MEPEAQPAQRRNPRARANEEARADEGGGGDSRRAPRKNSEGFTMNTQEELTASNGRAGGKILPLVELKQPSADAPERPVVTLPATRAGLSRKQLIAAVVGALVLGGSAAYWLYARQFE